MGFVQGSATIETTTTGNVAASNGDMIFVCVREIIATPATPSGTGLPAFTLIDLTGGNANNAGDSVRAAWYRTKCDISFNDTLAFANSAFGYLVYVYSGLVTTGSNGADSVLQAVGHFDNVQDNPAVITIAIDADNIGVCGWIGAQPLADVTPTTPEAGWATDADLYDVTDTVFSVGQSIEEAATSEASVTFSNPTQLTHGVALELAVDTPPPPGGDVLQSGAGGYVGWPFGLAS